MHRSCLTILLVSIFVAALPALSPAVTVSGGGSATTDCLFVLDVDGANKPAPPKAPKGVDCVDGDATCDSDGLRNGECIFPLRVCINSTEFQDCTSDFAQASVVEHAIDDGIDTRFDTDFQALQSRINGLGLPSSSEDQCSLSSSITVRLRGPGSNNVMKVNRKILRIATTGEVSGSAVRDKDKVKFTCRPEGDGVYLPTDLYSGTFDRLRKQMFAQSCAVSACHDSEGNAGNLILLSGVAYSNLVDVTPDNFAAATDGLKRVTPGDVDKSLWYLKIAGGLDPAYGEAMPKDAPALDANLVEIARLWILGDMTLGPAPESGWVVGTDQ
jgi:hypothetical protein